MLLSFQLKEITIFCVPLCGKENHKEAQRKKHKGH